MAGFKRLPSGGKVEERDGHTHSVCDLYVTHSLCDSVMVSTCLCSSGLHVMGMGGTVARRL